MKKICKRIFILLLLLSLSTLFGCTETKESYSEVTLSGELAIQVKSEKELLALINGTTDRGSTGEFDESTSADDSTLPTDSLNEKSESTYETNTQVEGVDESDIVKVEGDYIYYLPQNYYSQRALIILKQNNNDIELVKKIDFSGTTKVISESDEETVTEINNRYPYDLYTTNDYIIVRLHSYIYYQVYNGIQKYYTNSKRYTEFMIYDRESLNLVKSFRFSGYNIDTRLIENKLYVVNQYYSYESYLDILPITGVDDEFFSADISTVWYCSCFGTSACRYTSIYTITLDKEISYKEFHFLSPYISGIYASKNAIYIYKTYGYNYDKDENIGCEYSDICIINIENDARFDGYIKVNGSINNQYWMDEYEGTLRVATTGTVYRYKSISDTYKYCYGQEIFNHLYTYQKDKDDKWVMVGKITENLGKPNERIKSVRFNKDKATIVTYVNTDPLYYIDLSDPTKPSITSELQVTGYSLYQHPYNENYVIGIGFETNEKNSITGYKLSLFDITDKTNIKQFGKSLILNYNVYIGVRVLENPKEIMLDLKNNIFGFDITKRNDYSSSKYTYQYLSEYLVFNIDLDRDQPIEILKEITFDISVDSSNENYYYKRLDRMVFINNYYYLLSDKYVETFKLIEDDFVSQGMLKY